MTSIYERSFLPLVGVLVVIGLSMIAVVSVGQQSSPETTINSTVVAPVTTYKYLPAIKQELARLNFDADCQDDMATCVFEEQLQKDNSNYKIYVVYNPKSETVYMYVEKFLLLTDCKGPSLELARKLLEHNKQMVTAKLEWHKANCTIRLSNSINTDSNFDRKAFRSQMKGLISTAKTLLSSLSEIQKRK